MLHPSYRAQSPVVKNNGTFLLSLVVICLLMLDSGDELLMTGQRILDQSL